MKLIIDDANIDSIKRIYEYYPVSGVTTNPSILFKTGRKPFDVLKEIREVIGDDAELHAQVISKNADGMVSEAQKIAGELGGNTFIKIPATEEGLKAIKFLSAMQIKTTATAIYAPMQGYLAGLCGASYAAVYVNRIDNLGYDGIKVACDIHDMFKTNEMSCQVLGASFKNSYQVLSLCKHGVGSATLAPDIFKGLVCNASVDKAVNDFIADFEKLAGEDKTMMDC